MMNMIWRDVDLAALAAAGKTNAEIAEIAGVAVATVRKALHARGLKANLPRPQTIRANAEEMPPAEAVDYLLSVLEEALPVAAGQPHEIDRWGVKFTPQQRLILSVLYDAAPEAVSTERLHGLLYASRPGDDGPEQKLVAVLICLIRRKLPAFRGRIVNHWGFGYSFEGAKR